MRDYSTIFPFRAEVKMMGWNMSGRVPTGETYEVSVLGIINIKFDDDLTYMLVVDGDGNLQEVRTDEIINVTKQLRP